MSDSRRALAWLRERCERRADRVLPLPFGVAIVTDALPRVHDANFVIVDRWDGNATDLAAAVDAAQLNLGFAHRRSMILDQRIVERLGDALAALGAGFCSRYLLMAHGQPPERHADPAIAVVELDSAEYEAVRATSIRDYEWGRNDEVVHQLVALGRRIEAAVPTRRFGVRDGTVVSYASLYVEAGVAEIDDVETRPPQRGRGYATAVVQRAVDEARAAGADLVFLIAAEDDWPQQLYRRLGFETIATQVVFGRAG